MKKKQIIMALSALGVCAFAPMMLSGCESKPGETGKSAYEIAVENGFVGSEADWLESLNGEDAENEERFCKVSFDYNLGNFISNYANGYSSNEISVKANSWADLPKVEENFEELSKYFKGWYTGNSVYDSRFTDYTPVVEDVKLYAMWDEELLKQDLYATEGLKYEIHLLTNTASITDYEGTNGEVFIPRLVKTNEGKFAKLTTINTGLDADYYGHFENVKTLNFTEDNYIRMLAGVANNGVLTTINGELNALTTVYNSLKNTPFMNNGIEGSANNIFIKWGVVLDGKSTTLKNVQLNDVRVIAYEAFKGNSSIENVEIKGTEGQNAFIGDYAFYGCSKLEQISSDVIVENIGTSAFENCSSLEVANLTIRDLSSSIFKNTSIKEYTIEKEIDAWGYSSTKGNGPFVNENSSAGIVLMIKSQSFVDLMFEESEKDSLLVLMEGVSKIIVDVSITVPEESLLNNSEYFTKDGNIYTFIYQE